MPSLRLIILCIALAFGWSSCGSASDGGRSESQGQVPAPEKFEAPEIPSEQCKGPEIVGGHDVRVAGMSCGDAARILQDFTTAFSDENVSKPLVERGNGWRCFQQIFEGGFPLQEVCWRGEGQVLIFNK